MKLKKTENYTLKSIYALFFRSQLILIVSLALFLGITGTLINLHFETQKRDHNLQNIAEAIARAPVLTEDGTYQEEERRILLNYLDSLKETLGDIDVISVVGADRHRVYHSNHELIGTIYDGNMPEFSKHKKDYYTVDETGPSGNQRRAYGAIYDENGKYLGFVMAIMLTKNIKAETMQLFIIFALITAIAIAFEVFISSRLSGRIKESLLGYEPDVFTAMYQMRDHILETLKEGIVAVNEEGKIQFLNTSARTMLHLNDESNVINQHIALLKDAILTSSVQKGKRELNVNLSTPNIIMDLVPIMEGSQKVGMIAILHNRAEYKQLMEDLSGTRYLVDSMRANNHDFTNKLHVILGLIQMEMYEDATNYIQNITMVQRAIISKVMNAITDPAVAALLIGKVARAAELNIKFILREGCSYSSTDLYLPSEMLITIIGNLLDNAFDAMNKQGDYQTDKELLFGIYSKADAVLITIDDTGCGITEENLKWIFDNGFSTKGEGRGTGLYQVKSLVEQYGGTITVESQEGVGTSFSVSFKK